jgi:hypothetical protein
MTGSSTAPKQLAAGEVARRLRSIITGEPPSVACRTEPSLVGKLDSNAKQTGCGALANWHYDACKSVYLTSVNGRYFTQNTAQVKRRLKQSGISSVMDEDGVSECCRALIEIENDQAVDYSGPLAGFRSGVHKMCGHRVLVTTSPAVITPVSGEWGMLKEIIESLLPDGQSTYLYGWLKCAVVALRSGVYTPGQAMAIAGPRDCGKSLVQKIITEILGGRCARPYQFMTGASPFNADLFGAEHLMVEDEAAQTSLQARRTFGALIKSCTVNEEQRLHAKGRDAVMLRPFWRLSITTNDEAENLMVLPPIDASLEDKIMLLKAGRAKIPMPTGSPGQRSAFWLGLMAELPAFLHWLLNEFVIPVEMQSERFCITHYHHPELLEHLDALAPETNLLRLIDSHIIEGDQWSGTAASLQAELTSNASPCLYEARLLLNWGNACAVYLGRLEKKHPLRVFYERTNSERRWIVKHADIETGA